MRIRSSLRGSLEETEEATNLLDILVAPKRPEEIRRHRDLPRVVVDRPVGGSSSSLDDVLSEFSDGVEVL